MANKETGLIQQSQNGIAEAFGELYDTHVRTIYNFIYYKTLHKETAEDLTSETFFKALRAISSVDPERSFVSWLYKIAQNTVYDHYRSKRHNEDIDDFWDIAEEGRDVTEMIDTDLQVSHLRKHLKVLSSAERDIVFMRIWQDLSYKDIAEILGKTEAGCKMSYSRSLAKLRELMPS